MTPPLYEIGVLTLTAYCQAYARSVEAEEKLQEAPTMLKTPSGYVQQSPWIGVANKQMELMGRYMAELGLTPTSRSRVNVADDTDAAQTVPHEIRIVAVYEDDKGQVRERGLPNRQGPNQAPTQGGVTGVKVDPRI